jgi:hypothetical protein
LTNPGPRRHGRYAVTQVPTVDGRAVRRWATPAVGSASCFASWRDWSTADDETAIGARAAFVLLCPPRTPPLDDDPTMRRCMELARRWGMTGCVQVYLYPRRVTSERELIAARSRGVDVVRATRRDRVMREAALRSGRATVVAAWGPHPLALEQWQTLPILGPSTMCLGMHPSGAPLHPLMVRPETDLVPWAPAVEDHDV